MELIRTLEPRIVWEFFDELSRIPRRSEHEAGLRAYVEDRAKGFELDLRGDRAGNLVVRKNANGSSGPAGIVHRQRKGNRQMYSLSRETLTPVKKFLAKLK